MSDYVCDKISANIFISYKKNDGRIYQTIRIEPSKPNYLKYFTLEKYQIGRTTHDLFQTLYVGDGDNIMFEHEKHFKNSTIIRYRIDNEIDIDLSDQEYHIEGLRPKFDSCEGCAYLIKSTNTNLDRCKIQRRFLKRYKKSCQDFLEKGEDYEI